MAAGMECRRPFVVSQSCTNSLPCCGCKAVISMDTLRVGLRIGRQKSCTVQWYHYRCFWTHCTYNKYIRGSGKDTLNELVEGLNTLNTTDKQNFQNEASTHVVKKCVKTKQTKKQKEKSKLHKGSVDDGDYEIDLLTFDLTDMLCMSVHKYQTDVMVSIRQYFKPTGATVAKPSQKGICLTSDQWEKLSDMKTDIDGAISEMGSRTSTKEKDKKKSKKKKKEEDIADEDEDSDHIIFSLAWKRRISVLDMEDEVIIDIRDYSEEKTFSPSTKGIYMTCEQWEKLTASIPEVNTIIAKLKTKS